MTIGVLLINLGTPDSCEEADVKNYLREFLFDPYVIDINPIARWLLLNLIILPRRPKQSAAAYKSIWTEQGSPLLVNSQQLADNAQKKLGDEYQVSLGMRYGSPSIAKAVESLQHCERIIMIPLFPQYSLAATESAIQKAWPAIDGHWQRNQVNLIRDFYSAPGFIAAQASLITNQLPLGVLPESAKLMFSYHGLPERHIRKTTNCTTVCNMASACPKISQVTADCYRAQCYATTRAIVKKLDLSADRHLTCFQSRLGRTPWIHPYTDEMFIDLAKDGTKHLYVICPSFVSDCLETLEEIAIRGLEQWQEAGGETLTLIPCLNSESDWLVELIETSEKESV
jgi:ferrochelatase